MDPCRPNILIIEPDVAQRSKLSKIFDEAGFEVREETPSSQGVAGVLELEPEVILLAEKMPPSDNVELLPLLRRLAKAPIFVMGEGGAFSKVDALLQGADMYMSKPLRDAELLARVRALIRRTRSSSKDDHFHPSQTSHEGARRNRARRGLNAISTRWVIYLFRLSKRMAISRRLMTS